MCSDLNLGNTHVSSLTVTEPIFRKRACQNRMMGVRSFAFLFEPRLPESGNLGVFGLDPHLQPRQTTPNHTTPLHTRTNKQQSGSPFRESQHWVEKNLLVQRASCPPPSNTKHASSRCRRTKTDHLSLTCCLLTCVVARIRHWTRRTSLQTTTM